MKRRSTLLLFTMAALFAGSMTCSSTFAEKDPSPAPSGIIEGKETKAKRAVPSENEKAIQVQEKGSVDAGKSGVTTQGSWREKPQPELDRRWIIQMKDEKGKEMPARKPVPIAWTGKDQMNLCEKRLPGLNEHYSKTRYYSVRGDACNTAASARAFLNLTRSCKGDCPPGFLEAKGYSPQMIRNVETLEELGQKRCMESVKETVSPVVQPKETNKIGRGMNR